LKRCPFANLPDTDVGRWGGGITADQMREMHWTKPQLVAQVRFVEWTAENRLRHAAFLGLRGDKSARACGGSLSAPAELGPEADGGLFPRTSPKTTTTVAVANALVEVRRTASMRPVVDRAVLKLIDEVTFTGADFSIQHDGVCRMNPELARRVAQLAMERCQVNSRKLSPVRA
jgi:ATP dependent DNA ligase C terminal region